MKNDKGFTLVELMVSLAIIGILGATAIPALQTFQERARGQEATVMARQIIEGQILYYLEHDEFYPNDGSSMWVIPDENHPEYIQEIKNALNIEIPTGRPLTYEFIPTSDSFTLYVRANFPIFKGGIDQLIGILEKNGNITWLTNKGSWEN